MSNIEMLREQIKQIDTHIIKLLSFRQKTSNQIGELKQAKGKEIIDLKREEKLFDLYKTLAEKQHLSVTFIEQIFKIIIAHSRDIQR